MTAGHIERMSFCYNVCDDELINKYTMEGINMLNLKDINWKKPGLFAAGVAFGTAGIKILTSDDAKKLYTNCTAAVLRAKSCVMKTATSVQENAGDILAEAKQINEDRAAEAEAEVVDDFCETEETAEDTAEATEE